MIIILISVAIFLVGHLLNNRGKVDWAIPFYAIGILVFCVSLITLLIVPLSYKGQVKKFEAFKQTISTARIEDISEIERAAILSKVAEWNEWVAETKYYNGTLFDLWIPDEAADLSPIR